MKLSSLMVLPLLAASALAGCADPSQDDVAATEAAATASTDGIAACQGRKLCTETFVIRTLMASDLRLREMFVAEEPTDLAREHFVSWMKASENTYSTFGVEAKPLGGGKYRIHISLGNADLGNGGTESGCGFDFTIDHDRIVEDEVAAFCAG